MKNALLRSHRFVILFTIIGVVLLDQVSKWLAPTYTSVIINTGISFGLFSGPLVTIGLLLFFIAFFEWSCPRWHKPYPFASGLLLGGAVSNLIDRAVLGGVRDFLPIPLLAVTNNLADWCIVVGLLLIAYRTYNRPSQSSKSK